MARQLEVKLHIDFDLEVIKILQPHTPSLIYIMPRDGQTAPVADNIFVVDKFSSLTVK